MSRLAPRRIRPSESFSLRPLLLALAGLGLAASTQAQTSGTLGEVQVSGEASRSYSARSVQVGTYRDQDPLDVPLTNNVVTREVLDAQGANTLHGALRNTAGVAHAQIGNATYDNIAIRGLLVDNQRNYRLNGSLPIVNLIATPLENKERVEVLKGAASLYYGLVPPSGIVNLVTKRAGAQPVTSIATSVNNHGGFDAHADIARRFGPDEAMGLRVNAVAGKQETGLHRFEGERSLLSLAHDWRVNRALSFKLDLEHYRKNVSEPATLLLNANKPAVPRPVDNRINHAGEWQRYKAEATNLLLRSDIALSDEWALTLETGRAVTERDRNFSTLSNIDLATGEGTLNISFVRDQRFANTNHRAELVGRLAAGALAHELTLGATSNLRRASGEQSLPAASVSQNYHEPRIIAPIARSNWTAITPSRVSDKGAYLFDRMSLGERWQLLAGLRYSDYLSQSGSATPYEASNRSPNLSVIYKPSSELSWYASYLEALEETGVAAAQRANAGELLPPAVNKQKELGVKARLRPGLLVQAAYFDIQRPQTTIDAANRFVIGGRSDYRGLELSASGALGRQWSLLASALLLDAEISQVGPGNAAELGKTPQNTARRTLSLFGEYRVPQVPGWSLNAGIFHVGKRPVNSRNLAYVDAYTTLSLGTRYLTKWNGSAVTWQANIDNATDRNYWSSTGDNYLAAGLPRTLRLAAKFDF
ncbi:TonB-dependent receptor [Ramlibacter sp. 2FC]|uniref:TonB-dependent siderophore receptor n=1 Tax=Ramlibacter sp. 2FC TaxID=2502188 RepID=UPI0010F5DA79|nr:TonB-dependent receptor [Ramlibacter sp. 2FC]